MQALEKENNLNGFSDIDLTKPFMTDREIEFLKSFLSKEQVVFEWGAGWTTLNFSKYVKEYYSVEHDFKWYIALSKKISKNVKLYYMPPNRLDLEWFPVLKEGRYEDYDEGDYHSFKDYLAFVKVIGSLEKKFDIVLIDGRVRVDCAIEILPCLNMDAVVFIHDFERANYWKVLENYYIVGIVDTLVALKKKKEKDFEKSKKDRLFLIKRYLLKGLGGK